MPLIPLIPRGKPKGMPMISIEQVKAARALLDWSQDDLAKAAGLSKPSINTLERRLANPKADTMRAIQRALEEAGVEFIEDTGVKLSQSTLKTKVFEGENSLITLVNDIFDTLVGTDKELMISGVVEEKYAKLGGSPIVELIEKRLKHGIRSKLILCEGDNHILEPPEHYRQIQKELFSKTPYYVYDNKFAIFLWGPPKKVVLIENAEIAAAFREQFMALWSLAKPLKTPR